MKKAFLYLLFLWLPFVVKANTYTLDNVPNVRLTDIRKHVSDPGNLLSAAATDSINAMLFQLEKTTGIETAIVVLPSIGDEDCFDFAYNLGRKWGVGKKKNDNGLVVLLVIDQRRVQFATGYGIEGDLPDAICKQIQVKAMAPSFKKGDWSTGMMAGVKMICGRLDGSMKGGLGETEEGSPITFFIVLFAMVGTFVILTVSKSRKANRCPHCGKHQLQRTDSQITGSRFGVKTEIVTYTCRHCGQKVIREQKHYDENNGGHGFGGPFIGGFWGGGSSGGGGGFSGGSFGGGSFGGGGSGTSF
jgi:uncharacterized protein